MPARLATFALIAPVTLGAAALASLPPVPVPPQNPVTEPKRVLGKILFWDEQLSSSNTVSCGTCHIPSRGGSDSRRQRTPGPDNLFNTPDDTFGSPGVIRSDALRNFRPDQDFGLGVQATGRNSQTFMMAAFAPTNFWDGRARGPFIDPISGQTVAPPGSALEIQALGPPVSDVEMGHEGRDWAQVIAKVASVRPLALASSLPPDMAAALASRPSYGDLFRAAFGSDQISAVRIAQALATYQRTLVPDQTPWDRFVAGETTALTPGQQAGLNTFNGPARCNACHGGDTFTGNGFRNIGLRPPTEDLGLQIVTGDADDRGKFKVPSLRNAGLRNQFMHNGQFTTIGQVVDFYARAPGAPQQFADNRDPIMPQINIAPQARNALIDFVTNALTDPRVAAAAPPFDRPVMYSERPNDRPLVIAGGVAGSGGLRPAVIAIDPPMLGNAEFRIGLRNALGGAVAIVMMSTEPPLNGRLTGGDVKAVMPLSGAGPGGGFGTFHWSIPAYGNLAGRRLFVQWQVADPAAPGGIAISDIAQLTLFCPQGGCPPACIADFNLDSAIDPDDLTDFITAFFVAPGPAVDVNADGSIDPDDLSDFITAFFTGCPQT